MTELVDIINNSGQIIGTMSREEAYQNDCALQVSGVLVFRSSGELILQRRGKNKKYPLCYDYSAAGHVLSGETFLQAAKRELKEELGLSSTNLINLGTVYAYNTCTQKKLRKLHQVFFTINDDIIQIYKKELDGFDLFTQQQLDELINKHPEKFTPTLIKVYKEIIHAKDLFTNFASMFQQM